MSTTNETVHLYIDDLERNEKLAINKNYTFSYYKDLVCNITYLSIANRELLQKNLERISKNQYIFYLDLEWSPDRCRIDESGGNPIAMFQIANSRGETLVVYNEGFEYNDIMGAFLRQNTFYMKDPSMDKRKLRALYPDMNFAHIIDIAVHWCKKLSLPQSFERLFNILVGETNCSIKDKKISMSKWHMSRHNVKQIVYAAFDVYALCLEHIEIKRRLAYSLNDVWAFFLYDSSQSSRPTKRIFAVDCLRRFWTFYTKMKSIDELQHKQRIYLVRQGFSFDSNDSVYGENRLEVSVLPSAVDQYRKLFEKVVMLMIGEYFDHRIKCVYFSKNAAGRMFIHFWAIDVPSQKQNDFCNEIRSILEFNVESVKCGSTFGVEDD